MTITASNDLGDLPKRFGTRLTEERERLGLAVHQLAHNVGITDYKQKRLENGSSVISIDYLQALSVSSSEIDILYIITGTR
ncbi:helix-turn-helix domain-containing protein [Stutzerimonas balearica]|uniref:helix-turn-helix domain-containing protein n=1 Tax=Stutzerimonas balearica TaxID=74829 RepID=UPI00289C31F3|nr:helix-turn-helix transcriptional regulator [Stutzerimonas balearica]